MITHEMRQIVLRVQVLRLVKRGEKSNQCQLLINFKTRCSCLKCSKRCGTRGVLPTRTNHVIRES